MKKPFVHHILVRELPNVLPSTPSSGASRMKLSPLPDDFEASAYGADHIMDILHQDVGIPLEELIKLDLQGLYDLVLKSVSEDLRERYERLVVIDPETRANLHRHVCQAVVRLRPDRSYISPDIQLMARREALLKLPILARDASLQQIETALIASGRMNRLALEDHDYDRYGAEMNRIISQRPHGRSPSIGQEPSEPKDDGIDKGVAKTFVAALTVLSLVPPGCSLTPHPRGLAFVWTEAGTEDRFAKLAETDDVVVLAFEPGHESEGPTNIAVYERRDSEVKFWPRCSPWCRSDGSQFMLASHDGKAGFYSAVRSLVALDKVPNDDFDTNVDVARRVLRQIASQTEI